MLLFEAFGDETGKAQAAVPRKDRRKLLFRVVRGALAGRVLGSQPSRTALPRAPEHLTDQQRLELFGGVAAPLPPFVIQPVLPDTAQAPETKQEAQAAGETLSIPGLPTAETFHRPCWNVPSWSVF